MLKKIKYPRRLFVRRILKDGIALAFNLTANFEVEGKENLPAGGPLLVVANHFTFLDPLAVIHTTPWPLEFVGGNQTPNAPTSVGWISKLFGVIPTFRGTGSRETLVSSEEVLKQKGVLAIFPEGGSWATVLRPARPGTAFLAWRTNAPLLPVGIDGLVGFFKRVRQGERPVVNIRYGKPFGPFEFTNAKRPSREELDEVGHAIMRRISILLPGELRGFYSEDPAIRAAARGTEIYPWATQAEF